LSLIFSRGMIWNLERMKWKQKISKQVEK
jgi:hypothetical protein